MRNTRGAIKDGRSELKKAIGGGRALILSAVFFSIFVNLLMLTGPIFMLQVYDRVLSSRSEETLAALCILVLGLYVLMALLDYSRGRVMARLGSRWASRLDERIFRAMLKRSVLGTNDVQTSNALRDLDAVQGWYASPGVLALMDLPWTPLFMAAIFVFHPDLGWLAVAGGGFMITLTIVNQLLTFRKTRDAQLTAEGAHALATELRQGSEIVLSQGMREAVVERLINRREEASKLATSATDWTGSFSSLIKSSRLLLQSAMLALGAYLVLMHEVTGGVMIASTIMLGRALAPIEQLMGQWSSMQRSRAGWSNLASLLENVAEDDLPTDLPRPEAHLVASGLSVAPPGKSLPTLKSVSIDLGPGKALGVLGRSGSGKSTLAKALVGLWRPLFGEVRLGGATLDQYAPDALGANIGYLPQSVTLFSGTVAENIARMAVKPDAEAVIEASKMANAHEMILALPNGYDSVIAGNASDLSGGQRQRIALARAMYGNPAILILDEPTSALDAEGSDALNASIRSFKASGKSVVVMTHRPNAIAECEQLLILEDGVPTAYGPRDEVLRSRIKNAQDIQNTRQSVSVVG